nr:uncharacterized protein LOC122172599 [Chrysemys picta bellii]
MAEGAPGSSWSLAARLRPGGKYLFPRLLLLACAGGVGGRSLSLWGPMPQLGARRYHPLHALAHGRDGEGPWSPDQIPALVIAVSPLQLGGATFLRGPSRPLGPGVSGPWAWDGALGPAHQPAGLPRLKTRVVCRWLYCPGVQSPFPGGWVGGCDPQALSAPGSEPQAPSVVVCPAVPGSWGPCWASLGHSTSRPPRRLLFLSSSPPRNPPRCWSVGAWPRSRLEKHLAPQEVGLSRGGWAGSCQAGGSVQSRGWHRLALPAQPEGCPAESPAGARVEGTRGTRAAGASWSVLFRSLGELGPWGAACTRSELLAWRHSALRGPLPSGGAGSSPQSPSLALYSPRRGLRVSEQCGAASTSELTQAWCAGKALGRAPDTWVRFLAPPQGGHGPISEGEGWG